VLSYFFTGEYLAWNFLSRKICFLLRPLYRFLRPCDLTETTFVILPLADKSASSPGTLQAVEPSFSPTTSHCSPFLQAAKMARPTSELFGKQ
jgi:hypothetical protein